MKVVLMTPGKNWYKEMVGLSTLGLGRVELDEGSRLME